MSSLDAESLLSVMRTPQDALGLVSRPPSRYTQARNPKEADRSKLCVRRRRPDGLAELGRRACARAPACTHRAIDGALALVREHPAKPEEIGQIRVAISERFATILRNHRPTTGREAKFSMEFAMASALVAHRVGLPELTDGFVPRGDVQALIERVAIDATAEYAPDNSGAAPFDQVTVTLGSGARLRGPEVRRAMGHAERPLSASERFEKFQGCLEAGGVRDHAAVLFDRLMTIEGTPARELTCLD